MHFYSVTGPTLINNKLLPMSLVMTVGSAYLVKQFNCRVIKHTLILENDSWASYKVSQHTVKDWKIIALRTSALVKFNRLPSPLALPVVLPSCIDLETVPNFNTFLHCKNQS